jgi:hypothetical protein
MNIRETLPSITLSTRDYNELLFVLGFPQSMRDHNVDFLARELRRAAVCHPDYLPDDVVALNSRVVFHIKGEPEVRTCLLVHPRDLLCEATEISVLTPLGTALLGLPVGAAMPFLPPVGEPREVKVEGIGMRFIGAGIPRRELAICGNASMPLRLPCYEAKTAEERPGDAN